MNLAAFFLIPVIVWSIGIFAVTMAIKGNFRRANTRTNRTAGQTVSGQGGRVASRRPQMEKGLFDMTVDRKPAQKAGKKPVFGGSFRNTDFDTYEAKGRRKDIVTGYDRNLKSSRTQMRRAAGVQYSHTYDGHERWDKCLPKEKDPWDPDFYA